MQTYTHLSVGCLLGALCCPQNHWAQAACAAGSIAPDVVSAAKFAFDKSRGMQPFSHKPKGLLILAEISHSIPIWLFLGWLTGTLCPWPIIRPLIGTFLLGGLIHEVIDGLTHIEGKYRDTDCSLLWPIPVWLPDLIGIWEYRYGLGILRPKRPEAVIFVLSALTAAALWLWL